MTDVLEAAVPERVRRLAGSASIQQGDTARRLAARGLDVINLAQGEPDFPAPPHVIEAAIAALRDGAVGRYTVSHGIRPLREAVARKFQEEHGLSYDADTEVLITPGARSALLYALQALLNAGDEVLVLEPCWNSYAPCVELAGGRAVPVAAEPKDHFRPSIEAIEARIGPRTRLVILNNPTNPSGAVWRAEEVAALAALVRRRGLLVIADELYERFLFVPEAPPSIATCDGMRERTIIVNGVSKTYAMAGWRIGYLVAPAGLMRHVHKIHQHAASCAASISQSAALAALTGPQAWVGEMIAEFRARRDTAVRAFAAVPGLGCTPPDGAFYALVDVRGWGLDSVTAARRWLEEAGVVVTPGVAFGASAEGFVRVSLAASRETLLAAADRVRAAASADARS